MVFIGIELDREGLCARLDRCLLTDSEMELGPRGWQEFADPLPGVEDSCELNDAQGEDSGSANPSQIEAGERSAISK